MNKLLELNNEDLWKLPTLIKTLVQQKSPTSETQQRKGNDDTSKEWTNGY